MLTKFWNNLTKEEITKLSRNTIIIVHFSAIEKHGSHLPINTDSFQIPAQTYDYNFGNMVQWLIPQAIETYKIEWDVRLGNVAPFTTGGTAPFDVPYLTIWQGTDSPKFFAQEAYDSQTVNLQAIVGDTIISLEDEGPDDNTLFVGLGYDPNQYYPDTSEVPVNIPTISNVVFGTVKIYRLV